MARNGLPRNGYRCKEPTVYEQTVLDALIALGKPTTSYELEYEIGSDRSAIGGACHRLCVKGLIKFEPGGVYTTRRWYVVAKGQKDSLA